MTQPNTPSAEELKTWTVDQCRAWIDQHVAEPDLSHTSSWTVDDWREAVQLEGEDDAGPLLAVGRFWSPSPEGGAVQQPPAAPEEGGDAVAELRAAVEAAKPPASWPRNQEDYEELSRTKAAARKRLAELAALHLPALLADLAAKDADLRAAEDAVCNLREELAMERAERERVTADLAAARAEAERLRDELADSLSETFFEIATFDTNKDGGWYCTNARGTANGAADRLVEIGRFEAHPDNDPKSRVNWFRPLAAQPAAAGSETAPDGKPEKENDQ